MTPDNNPDESLIGKCKDCVSFDGKSRCSRNLSEGTKPSKHCSLYEPKQGMKIQEQSSSGFVLDNNEMPQIIDHAVGSVKIGDKTYRYYGQKMMLRCHRSDKGVDTTIIKSVPAIVLENGQIISEERKPQGCNFKFGSTMNMKYNRWSLNSVKAFCDGQAKDVTFSEVFEVFKRTYDLALSFEQQEWYDLNALWDMQTYFHDIIDKAAIIKHSGISGTGKSKVNKNSSNLSFNGRVFLCPTPANFFRYRNNNKATLYIEEAEKLFSNTYKKNNADSDLVEYLNGSYEKGNCVPRQNDKDLNQTDEFDPFGFTRISAISPLKGALEKRSINMTMVKADKNDERANVEIPLVNDREYQDARDMMYIAGLKHYKEYQAALRSVKNNYGLHNREWLISKPLLAMAHCIDPALEIRMGKFITRLFEERDDTIDESSWEVKLALCLVAMTCTDRSKDQDGKLSKVFISTGSIKGLFEQSVGDTGVFKMSSHRVTKLMAGMGFARYKCRSSDGTERGYDLNFIIVCKLLLQNDIISKSDIIKKVSEVSVCQYSDDEIDKYFTDKYTDTSKTKVSVSDKLTDRTLFLRGRGSELIHHHCSNCGKTPCIYEHKGKPVCQDCAGSLRANGEVVV